MFSGVPQEQPPNKEHRASTPSGQQMSHTHPSPPAPQQALGGSMGLANVGTLQRGVLSMSESQYPEQH